MAHMQTDRTRLLARVHRITGQMAAIERAIDDDAACADVLHQVAGARGAINGLMNELIEEHLREHVARPDLDAEARQAGMDELVAVIRRYAK
ncbi:metal/formaldehyde-sensitive transcriptional repressor [Croceicoccus naphthovorans]|uniref:Transcriptional regulator n=1 Tax=Croceicoccus naphthovorans TaxID=1348774 RepID=A0A0G3XC41_9SPHN|nr:metal/formaldehyde-sensitive transcriptional repressor [Croceicoccus naphthovorans]AKM09100.1 transcriptional regulator [Croceicoccus naphthovorans]MBB3991656.1 DNA-binding FrmR family transcriptional regulator [Croceicoccus naphthovorans]